ncbi:MAG TPA: MaoC/PaaZ C-terminal domain-containing protein [Methylomirabilota bacterium]|nr:MaoC/PaaZ C-terminal domain-containing protein [Methylomirabilota bacterium]
MTLSPSMVGRTAGPYAHDIDARWLMAYAAALEETAPEYFDTTRPEGLVAHPLFSVCYEWPAAVELRAKLTSEEIAARSVHATHDLVIHRPVKAGDRLETTATVSLIEPRSPGAYQVTRFETVDERGQPVTTTEYGSIYRSVSVDPAPVRPKGSEPMENESSGPGEGWSTSVHLSAGLAHVYTECARIWNPIHTDRAVAVDAGLPDIILHGTATLALAVSQVLQREPAEAARRVRRIACRFTGMVRLPSVITVQGVGETRGRASRVIAFQVLAENGRPAVTRGLIEIGA